MGCEIYSDLKRSSLLKTRQRDCPYEKGCPKTCGDCEIGKIIKRVENNAKIEYETPEDVEQDKILAELRAKAEFNSAVKQLKEESIINSLISVSRVN